MHFAKKSLYVVILFFVSTFSLAQESSYLQQMVYLETNRNTNQGSEYYETTVGNKYNNWDFSTCFGIKEGSENLEHRIKYTVDMIFFEYYIQERLGYQWDTNRSLSYYAIDSGFIVLLADKHQHKLNFMFRYKNSFEPEDQIEHTRYGVELSRKISKHLTGAVAYMQTYGDKEVDIWRFGLTYRF